MAEIWLARRIRANDQRIIHSEQHSQWLLWFSVVSAVSLALLFKQLAWLPLPIAYLPRQLLALALFAAGLYLRYAAIAQLGHLFTTHIAVQQQHSLIKTGPYRWLRHPAYSGLLLALAAAGLAMGDSGAILALMLLPFAAFSVRIKLEETMLKQAFGEGYTAYCQQTWRMIPWIY